LKYRKIVFIITVKQTILYFYLLFCTGVKFEVSHPEKRTCIEGVLDCVLRIIFVPNIEEAGAGVAQSV
jgi:hypothetical protein